MKLSRLWMIAAILVCGVLLTACSADDNPTVEPTTELLKDGVWTGSGEGRSGIIVVKMTVENHEITDIVVVSQSESSFAQEAINEMVARALQKQGLMSVEVDGVTGATLTSTGVINAVNMAILAAQGKAPSGKKTYTEGRCDIVVVGAGGAGLSAAVEAASHGDLQIIVLEKQGILGGNTNYSTGGINAAGTESQQALGINDSPELFYDDTMRGGKYQNIPSLVRSLVDNAAPTVAWLSSLGADLSDVGLMGGSSVKRTHRPKGGTAIGAHLMKVLKEASSKANIEIRTSNKVTGLLTSNGTVTGVRVENVDGTTYRLQSKAVVIATGGFGANLQMVTSYQPWLTGFATLNHPGATGDAFAWIETVGGSTIQMDYIQIHPTAEADNHILITEAVRGNGAILVNHNGMRFVNEMDTRDVVSAAILAQPSEEAFLIFDQAVRQSLASIETYANQHLMIEGTDAASLATKAGLPISTFLATIDRYATFQKTGLDEDFGRSSTQMTAALDTPPYYAIRVKPAIHHTMGGIRVDADMHVLRADNTPVPGLFAAGEVTGGIHGANRLGGNGVADIVVNGKIAGRGAAMNCQ
ncbi:MAG: flavocytochrome c [Prevotella sp.]|nr:flavocytochrome c [Prevotella sp.]